MKLARLERQVAIDEGYRANPYQDTLGFWTIGYGTRWVLGDQVTGDTPPISESAARTLLRAGLWKAALDAQEIFPTFHDMNDLRQEILVNMAYNLGFRGLAGFARMRAAALELDHEAMAAQMENSRWFDQVGNRSRRLVHWMRTGSTT